MSQLTQRLSFEEAAAIVARGSLELLGRSARDQEEYLKYISELKEKWVSIGDFILHDKFDFPIILGDDGKQKAILPKEIGCSFSLKKNDFPYFFEDDVEHHVLWKLNSEVTAGDVRAAALELQRKRRFVKYTWYINPPNLKSVLDVQHAHVIIKLEKEQLDSNLSSLSIQGDLCAAFKFWNSNFPKKVFETIGIGFTLWLFTKYDLDNNWRK